MGKSEVARTFGMSLSSFKRYARPASEGRSMAPKKRPDSKLKLEESARRLLSEDLEERPFVTLSESGEYLEALPGISVSDSTVCRELKRMEHTCEKGA